MGPATILATVSGGHGSNAVIEAAVALGRRFGAGVDFVHLHEDAAREVPIVAEAMSGAVLEPLIASAEEAVAARAKEARALFEQRCVSDGLFVREPDATPEPGRFSVSYQDIEGDPIAEIAIKGRCYDLIVVGRPAEPTEQSGALVVETALMQGGRPLWICPLGPGAVGEGTVAIAWNGTPEAARALGAAVPFAAQAGSAIVMTVRDHCDAEPESLRFYFAQHGIAAEFVTLEPDYRPVGEQLLEEATSRGAGLFAMGAYGHSRLREFVLGGVTRSILTDAKIPILMMH